MLKMHLQKRQAVARRGGKGNECQDITVPCQDRPMTRGVCEHTLDDGKYSV